VASRLRCDEDMQMKTTFLHSTAMMKAKRNA
jgi:hypothetical protein